MMYLLSLFLQQSSEKFHTFKETIRAGGTQGATFHQKLMSFLLVYWSMPHITVGWHHMFYFLKEN